MSNFNMRSKENFKALVLEKCKEQRAAIRKKRVMIRTASCFAICVVLCLAVFAVLPYLFKDASVNTNPTTGGEVYRINSLDIKKLNSHNGMIPENASAESFKNIKDNEEAERYQLAIEDLLSSATPETIAATVMETEEINAVNESEIYEFVFEYHGGDRGKYFLSVEDGGKAVKIRHGDGTWMTLPQNAASELLSMLAKTS